MQKSRSRKTSSKKVASMGVPLFDLSALSAVQTVFEPAEGIVDPWGAHLAGSLANVFIYSENIRFSLPAAEQDMVEIKSIVQPSLIHDLANIDTNILKPVVYPTSEQLILSDENIRIAFDNFSNFARYYKKHLQIFCKLHQTKFVKEHQTIRIKHGLTYDLSSLLTSNKLIALSKYVEIEPDIILYAFDLCLRYPNYVKMAGRGNFYLNHNIRDGFRISNEDMTETDGKNPPIALSFAPSLRPMVSSLNRQEYITVIKILREKIRETGLISLKREEISKDMIREVALSAKLRPRLRAEHQLWDHIHQIVGIAVGGIVLAATGQGVVASITGAASGSAVKFAVTAWKKPGKAPLLSSKVSEFSCLRWAVKWDIEDTEGGSEK